MSSLKIPPLDPLVLNRTQFEYNRGPMHGKLSVRSAIVHGLALTEIRSVRTDISDAGMELDLEVFYPRVQIDGGYRAEGQFNGYRMNARGNFNVTFSECGGLAD